MKMYATKGTEKMRKWENVKDEKPEHGEDVLGYDDYFGYAIGWFESDLECWFCEGIGRLSEVTHWQRLPRAPRGE